jgi:superfamily II DNA or RNA helicase
MNSFPSGIQFKYKWREYQQNILDHLDEHLSGKHLHIVAPPGSGKTVLGLEIMLRLNEPALIITPTLAIRSQWIQRFCELFVDEGIIPEWVSTDIKNPGLITVTTYQAIHTACHSKVENLDKKYTDSEPDISLIIEKLKKKNVTTFILDEAHHLKSAWWKSITAIKEKISPTIVALTATPPFDVSGLEWERYIQLNGPVDIEISVPELMLEGDLCPHQDLVYFATPAKKEKHTIESYYDAARNLFEELKTDKILLYALENHPVYENPEMHLEWIYDNISSYTSGLVYLNFRGKEIADIHFEIVGAPRKIVPAFNFFWLEKLLCFYLFTFDDYFNSVKEHRTHLESRLKRNGFLENKTISFFNNKNLNKLFNLSTGKLQGIKNIVDFEYSVLKDDLKMVILTDFIKKEFLTDENQNNFEPDKIGAVPIFEMLRREKSDHRKVGVLTGSIVIIPKSSEEIFKTLCLKKNLTSVSATELSYDHEYLLITISEAVRHAVVEIVTEIFQSGEIHVLIGTKSLLGEGWDAPKMNTLILASFVSSFVLSNQMRGRVIRTDKDTPHKTGNIWHLVCFDDKSENGGYDFDILKKRFKTFTGISNSQDPTIENNFERLNIKIHEQKRDFDIMNLQTFITAKDRERLSKQWSIALDKGSFLIEEIKVPENKMRKSKEMKLGYLKKMIGYFSGIMFSVFFTFLYEVVSEVVKSYDDIHFLQGLFKAFLVAGILGIFTFGSKFIKAARQYFKYKNIAKHLELIGNVVLKALIHENIIKTPAGKLKIVSSADIYKNPGCYLQGGSAHEKSIFISVLQELISQNDNPRYLLKQENSFLFIKQDLYFAVPEVFGKNKKSAEFFRKIWNETFDKTDLIFTRTTAGRKILLRLRFQNLIDGNARIEHVYKWTK